MTQVQCRLETWNGWGRYGNIGEFACQSYGSKYHATDDDCNPSSPLHILNNNQKLFDLQKEHNLD